MIGVATNSYFTACFLRKIVELLGGPINDPLWVVILLPLVHSSNPTWSWSGSMNGCLSLHSALQGPSTWLVDSAPELQRYKDTVRCIALGGALRTMSKTSNANLSRGWQKRHPFKSILDCKKPCRKQLVTRPDYFYTRMILWRVRLAWCWVLIWATTNTTTSAQCSLLCS